MKKIFTFKIIALGFLAGLINGLLGSGGGTLLVPGMYFLLDLKQHQAHATAISIILPLALISTFIYIKNGIILWNVTLKIVLGGMIGGYIGAKLLNKTPSAWLRKIFGMVMIIAALRMVF